MLATLGTSQNIFCFNNIVNDNFKQDHPGKNKVGCTLFAELRAAAPGYVVIFTDLQIVLNTQNNPYLNQATQNNTCQIFLPKKIQE